MNDLYTCVDWFKEHRAKANKLIKDGHEMAIVYNNSKDPERNLLDWWADYAVKNGFHPYSVYHTHYFFQGWVK